MDCLPPPAPSLQALQLAVLHGSACGVLYRSGSVKLGKLLLDLACRNLMTPYADIVRSHYSLFITAENAELLDLYELALNLLEQDFGPLRCTSSLAPDRAAPRWGYAAKIRADNLPEKVGRRRKGEVDIMWDQRRRALQRNHPDQAYYKAGRLPLTEWHRTEAKLG